MTQADCVLSTPSTNTSVLPQPVPAIGRRNFLGVTVAALATGAVVNATAAASALASEPDPIFAMIERHRELSAHVQAAVAIHSKLPAGPEYDAAEAISAERNDLLEDHANALICSAPFTIAGALAVMRYVGALDEWQQPSYGECFEASDGTFTLDWVQTFLNTLACAIQEITETEGAIGGSV